MDQLSTLPDRLYARIAELEARLAAVESERDTLAATLADARAADERREVELRQERRLYRIFEQIPVGVFFSPLEPSRRGTYISSHIERLLGFTPAEWTHDPDLWVSLIHPDDREAVLSQVAEARTTGRHVSYEYRIRHRDGHYIWAHEEVELVTDEAGGSPRFQGFFYSITARKAAEAAAQTQEARYRELVENLPVLTYRVDAVDGRLLYMSPFAEQLLGYTPGEFDSWSELWRQRLHPDDAATAIAAFDAAVNTGDRLACEYRICHRDGHYVWLRDEATVLPETPDEGPVLLGFAYEISKRKWAEQALRQAEALYRSLAENIPDVITRLDREMRTLYISPNIEQSTGIPVAVHLGRTGLELGMPPEIFAGMAAAVARAFDSDEPQTFEFANDTPAGRKSYEARIMRERGPDGAADTVMVISRDVTEQRHAEAALRGSEERLRTVLSGMPIMLDAFDEHRRLAVWNAECERVTGYSAAEMLGRTDVNALLYPDKAFRDAVNDEWARRGPDFRNWEFTLTRKDGQQRIVSWSNVSGALPVPGWSFWAVGVDVTEQRRAEAALRESQSELRLREQQFSALVENSPDVIFRQRIAPELAYEYVSPATQRLVGYPPEAFLADPQFLAGIVHPDDRPIVAQLNAERRAPAPFIIRLRHRDGRLVWAELNISPIYAEDGAVVALEGVFHDITAHKLLEQNLLRQTRLQGMLAASLRILHSHGHDETARQRIFAAVAAELCYGIEAAHVLIWELNGRTSARLAAAAGPEGAVALGEQTVAVEELPAAVRELFAAEPGQAPYTVPAFASAGAPDEEYYLLPIGWPVTGWGMVAVGVPRGATLAAEDLTFAATVTDILSTTLRRWLAVDALQASERRLRLAIEAAQMGTFELDVAAGSLTASKRFSELIGIASEAEAEVFPMGTLTDRLHPDDREAALGELQRTLTTGSQVAIEGRILQPDGTRRWVRSLGQILFGPEGAPERLVGVSMDVTAQRESQESLLRLNVGLEQRVQERTRELERTNAALRQEIADRERAEAALLESQRFLERVMAAYPAQIYVYDYRQQKLVYSNKPLAMLLGFPESVQAELGDYPIANLMHPDDAARLPGMYQDYDLIGDDGVLENEFRVRQADGGWRWFATRDIVFARGPDGKPTQMLGAGIDITARKEVETDLALAFRQLDTLNTELRRSDSLLRTIVNSLVDGLALVDAEGRLLMANQALASLFRLDPSALVGRQWSAVCPFNSPMIEQAIAQGLAFSGRERVAQEGLESVFDIQAVPLGQ